MTRNIHEPSLQGRVQANQFGVKDLRQRPGALRWWVPDCSTGDPDDAAAGCTGLEPPLVNGWAQPTGTDLQFFAFRMHSDGSLEFRGHLDAAGASSGTVAVTLPGANDGDADFLSGLSGDQFYNTVIYDGVAPQHALFYIDKSTGDVTITWPFV